jgi:hypothetical protein
MGVSKRGFVKKWGLVNMPSQKGFSLLIASAVIASLIVLGLVMSQYLHKAFFYVSTDRVQKTAFFIAEAGLFWGVEEVEKRTLDTLNQNIVPGRLNGLPKIDQNLDPTCLSNATCPLYGWRTLHPASLRVVYGSGTYRVAVRCYPEENNCVSAKEIVVRSVGEDTSSNTPRILEVTLQWP